MSDNERELLFLDLCARLPYDVYVYVEIDYDVDYEFHSEYNTVDFPAWILEANTDEKTLHLVLCDENDDKNEYFQEQFDNQWVDISEVKPYLRPLSDMTEMESVFYNVKFLFIKAVEQIDWLNKHHFDYRGLIEKGLAIAAPKEIYNIE